MAFNPFTTFQKNRRFWMAAILMICMVTFVFCTGGMSDERWGKFFRRSGPPIAKVHGRAVTSEDLAQLKAQRNFANEWIMGCCEIAFKKLSKRWFDETVKFEGEKDKAKDVQKRASQLAGMKLMIDTIAYRKNKPRYFDGGVKLDDLLEFMLWQAQADKMGVHLEERDVDRLFQAEFFHYPEIHEVLTRDELRLAEGQAMRGGRRDGGHVFARQAITEEFRVKIAQYAVLGVQPSPYLFGDRREGLPGLEKYANPEVPDEIRAPMALAQLSDFYRKQRALFNVTLVPVKVADFLDKIKDTPSDIQRKEFFDLNKNKPADPSSDEWGLERQAKIQMKYLIADPKAPGYQDLAQLIAHLNVLNPIAYDPLSPIVTATRYMAVAQKHQIDLDNHHQAMLSNVGRRGAALYSEKDCVTPILDRFAQKHPEAIASLVGAAALPNLSPIAAFDVHGATAGYLAWGALKHGYDGAPAYKETDGYLPASELEMALHSEMRRRAPAYAQLFAFSAGYQSPFEMMGPFVGLDKIVSIHPLFGVYANPQYTTETIQREIKTILARQIAEEWAQANIQKMRRELDKAVGDAEKYKKVLRENLKELWPKELQNDPKQKEKLRDLKLTYGPPDGNDSAGYTKFTVQSAPELAPLRDAFSEYAGKINGYEARDVTPEKLLKPTDFHKMFFDSSETFSATALHRAMIWPPEVKRNSARMWKKIDPRLVQGIDQKEEDQLMRELLAQDGVKQAGLVDHLFITATKPMLFWRTTESAPVRYSDYDRQLVREYGKFNADLAVVLKDKEQEKSADALARLNERETDLKSKLADLEEVAKRIVDGWKFERARTTEALPDARKLANDVLVKLKDAHDDGARSQLLLGLKRDVFNVAEKKTASKQREYFDFDGMSLMHAESFQQFRDYSKYPMPKGKVEFPRDDMVDQALKLVDLKEPIKIQHKDADSKSKELDTLGKQLDEINKELFDEANKLNKDVFEKDKKVPNPATYHVQILTDKPRSTFFVAFITKAPIDPTWAKADPLAKKEYETLLQEAFLGARHNKQGGFRDLFIERAQQEHAKTMRADLVGNLQRVFNFDPPSAESRKNFDDRAGD